MEKRGRIFITLAIIALALGCLFSRCPQTCDDDNPCTSDYCSQATDYKCAHMNLEGPQDGCSGSAGSCREKACIGGKCSLGYIKDCCGNMKCESGEDEITCPVDCSNVTCPKSCIDDNPCTIDYCGEKTGYTCMHDKVMSVECGTKCPKSCNDYNPCTRDYCGSDTGFKCMHDKISPCCGDLVCEFSEYNTSAYCPNDCPLTTPLKAEIKGKFNATEGGFWTIPVEIRLKFQFPAENITFQINCNNGTLNPGENKPAGVFLTDKPNISISGYVRTDENAKHIILNTGENKGTRILKTGEGTAETNPTLAIYFTFKPAYFYSYDILNQRTPKNNSPIECVVNVSVARPIQNIATEFRIEYNSDCYDGIQNQGEVGVDCGGPCGNCACFVDRDCGDNHYLSSKEYCDSDLHALVRDYMVYECVKPLWSEPYCNSTVVQRIQSNKCPYRWEI